MKKRIKNRIKNTGVAIALGIGLIFTSTWNNKIAQASEQILLEDEAMNMMAERDEIYISLPDKSEEPDDTIIMEQENIAANGQDKTDSEKYTVSFETENAVGESKNEKFVSPDQQTDFDDEVITEIMDEEKQEDIEEETEILQKTPNLQIMAKADTDSVKAGELLVYEVEIKNTGNVDLHKIAIQSVLSEISGIEGTWEDAEGLNLAVDENEVKIDILNPGQERHLYYTIQLPEETVSSLECRFQARVAMDGNSESQNNITENLIRETSVQTVVLPLTVDFSVKKTADRKMAVPGDTIYYQICIKNTGERTLHSVLTTERFQMENIHVQFVEKEGVLLNGDKTQALISKIEPGQTFGLQAAVTLPEDMVSQELINYVTVVTRETEEKIVEASSAVKICGKEPTPAAVPTPTVVPLKQDVVTENIGVKSINAVQASTNPKTADMSQIMFWAALLGASFLSAGHTFWLLKAKRKH